MRSSRKGVRYAVLGFVLIVVAVLGGMGWATAATWQLAKVNLQEARMDRVNRALGRLDDYILGTWKKEAARDIRDYQALYNPIDIYDADNGFDLAPWKFLLPSPLLRWRPSPDWIDLYFQVNETGDWSSPQIPDPEQQAILNLDSVDPGAAHRASITFRWLCDHLTVKELQIRLSRAKERDRMINDPVEESESESESVVALARTQSPQPAAPSPAKNRVPLFRTRNERTARQKVVPPTICLPTDVARGIVHGTSTDWNRSFDDDDVEVRGSTLYPFWIEPLGNEPPKIAFIRTAHPAADTIYQGFVGDWNRLKIELLKRISDLAPSADLEPIVFGPASASPTEIEIGESEMTQLPVRLKMAEQPLDVWPKVQGKLLASWAAALVVLVATGWGVRNLVSLTERRLQFAYAVTHELRTPLTTFRLYTDLLSAGLVPDESKQLYLDTLHEESERLSTLVEDVLEYARLENHKVRLNPVQLDGDSLLRKLRESLESRCKVSGITPQTQNELPDSQSLRTDIDLVSQIAGVLVNNACRHAKNSPNPAVHLRLAGENGHLMLDVADSGPGIDRTDARRIFKPFRRGRNADVAAQGGIGLGLSLARSWATLLGGRLELVARHHPQHGGAHFRLTIPSSIPNGSA